jgi:hypothetical protein
VSVTEGASDEEASRLREQVTCEAMCVAAQNCCRGAGRRVQQYQLNCAQQWQALPDDMRRVLSVCARMLLPT